MVARPAYLPKPFADLTVDKNIIPENPIPGSPGNASLDLGFPPVTKQPLTSGGLPPLQEDFNGALNQLYQFAQWQQSGGKALWNALVDEYPIGVIVQGSDFNSYRCLVPNGSDTTSINPVGDLTSTWIPEMSIGVLQAWTDVKAARATDVTYTNTTGRPIQLSVSIQMQGSGSELVVDGLIISRSQNNNAASATRNTFYAIIPNLSTYSVVVSLGTIIINEWFELF